MCIRSGKVKCAYAEAGAGQGSHFRAVDHTNNERAMASQVPRWRLVAPYCLDQRGNKASFSYHLVHLPLQHHLTHCHEVNVMIMLYLRIIQNSQRLWII